MRGRNLFCPLALGEELEQVREQIAYVRAVACGDRAYEGPVPSLVTLERLEVELLERIALCTFPRAASA